MDIFKQNNSTQRSIKRIVSLITVLVFLFFTTSYNDSTKLSVYAKEIPDVSTGKDISSIIDCFDLQIENDARDSKIVKNSSWVDGSSPMLNGNGYYYSV